MLRPEARPPRASSSPAPRSRTPPPAQSPGAPPGFACAAGARGAGPRRRGRSRGRGLAGCRTIPRREQTVEVGDAIVQLLTRLDRGHVLLAPRTRAFDLHWHVTGRKRHVIGARARRGVEGGKEEREGRREWREGGRGLLGGPRA
eukprot:2954845-Rhodomonas_salina.2